MTSPFRRIRVLVGALCAASLSLALAADAATTATSTERARKRRRAPVDQALDQTTPAWSPLPILVLGLPYAYAPTRYPDAVPWRLSPAAVAEDGATTSSIVKRARRVGFGGTDKHPHANPYPNPPGIPASPTR